MAFTVHRLAAGDIAHFRALNAMFGKAFDDAESYGAKPPSDAYLEALLAKQHVIALVALSDGRVMGGLVAYELDKFEQERREVCLRTRSGVLGRWRFGELRALVEHHETGTVRGEF